MKVWIDGATTRCCYMMSGRKAEIIEFLKPVTSNQGEYKALINALAQGVRLHERELEVYTDSQLVANQNTLKPDSTPYARCKDEKLMKLKESVDYLRALFDNVVIAWIPREDNPAGALLEDKRLEEKRAEKR